MTQMTIMTIMTQNTGRELSLQGGNVRSVRNVRK
jgi:hypothetical protein